MSTTYILPEDSMKKFVARSLYLTSIFRNSNILSRTLILNSDRKQTKHFQNTRAPELEMLPFVHKQTPLHFFVTLRTPGKNDHKTKSLNPAIKIRHQLHTAAFQSGRDKLRHVSCNREAIYLKKYIKISTCQFWHPSCFTKRKTRWPISVEKA